MKHILLIGATGRTGRRVITQLPTAGVQVRALVRDPEKAAIPPHIEVVRGDLTVPESLDAALDGIDTVFLVWMAPPATVVPALERITRQARRIVFLSAPLKTPHPLFQQPNSGRNTGELIERLIEASGREWTFLRPGMFSANALFWWQAQIRRGDLVRWPHLSVPTAPIDERDIAAIAVRALCEDGHNRGEYLLTGPEALTHREQISIIGEVLGRPLRIEEMTTEEAKVELLAFLPPMAVKMLMDAWGAAEGHPAFQSPMFAEITGTPPRSFRQWVADNAASFSRVPAQSV